MNRLLAAILVSILIATVAVEVSTQENRQRVFNWRGDQGSFEREGDTGVTRITEFWCMSDSLVVTADLAERRENEVSGTDEFFLSGNVVAEEDSTRITGERGKYDRSTDLATVAGSVLIIDGDTEITCEEAEYDRNNQLINLRGIVEIRQPGSRLNADRMVYHRETGFAEAWGHVELEDYDNQTLLRGEHGSYDRESGEAMMDRNPSLFRAEAGDSIRLTAALMRQFGRDSMSVAVGDVRYLRGATEALCDSAIYFRDEDRLQLFGEPRMIRSGSVLSGDSLDLHFVDGDVDRMRVAGDARFQGERADARVFPDLRSEITGDRFDIDFVDGDIREVAVQGNPRSLYIPDVEEEGRASINEAHGDSMLLRFDTRELEEVRIFGSAEGSYRFLDGWREAMAAPDTLGEASGSRDSEDLAQVIDYRARDIIYHAAAERAYLEGEAEVESPDFILRAKTIRFDSRADFLDARGEPLLIDRGDELYGELMEYDIDEKVGLVHEGATRYGEGFYTGERLKKRPGDLVHARTCGYTTCDLDDPHFHFRVDRMTIRPGDKIVGAPVRFYLGDIPLFYLPFLFNDLGRGRHSGFLQPDFEFGISLDENKPQRFIRDLGYYWALGEYADMTMRGNFEENRSLFGSLSYRFYRRYFMGGAVRSSFTYDVKRDLVGNAFHWGLTGTHSQNFGERSKLNATVDFASSESLLDIDNYSVEQVIDQKLSTNLSFSRKWDNLSLNTSYSRTQYLNREDDDPDTDKVLLSESTPLSLSATPIPLFPGFTAQDGIRGALGKLKLTPRLSYSRKRDTKESGHSTTESASTSTSFGLGFKLGVINVRPSVGISENWSRSSSPVSESASVPFGKPDDPQGGTPLSPIGESGDLDSGEILVQHGGEFSHRWNASTAISTRFFGLFYPRIGNLTGVRHTVAPSASWNYSESRGKSFSLTRRIGLTLDNSIDLKFGEGEEVRRQSGLLTWNLSTGYDLDKTREELPWSTLSSSVQFNPLRNFSLSLHQSFDPNRNEKLSTTISGNLSLTGNIEYGHIEQTEQLRNIVARREDNTSTDPDTLETEVLDESDGSDFDPNAPLAEGGAAQPGQSHSWNLSSSFSLNRTRSGAPSPTVNLRGGIALTENWALDYRTSLSLDSGEMGSQTIRLTRDLHCWAASFSRVVFQDREQYYLRIYLKAHAQDIKIESGDRSAGYGGY